MHGQTATRRNDERRFQRTAAGTINSARIAAENGWRNRFALSRFRTRRMTPPAPALTNISMAGQMCWTPNITANATAPAAAASAKRPVGIGGNREISSTAFAAPFGARRPATVSSITRIVTIRDPFLHSQEQPLLGLRSQYLRCRPQDANHPNAV